MDNKHASYDLAQMQSLPLSAKIRMTQQRIRQWYDSWNGDVYVSISGGKDSQVLAHIVKQMYSDVPLVFINTGLEYDSVRLKGEELADEVLRPEMSFVDVIKKHGYPIISKEVSQKVCEIRTSRSRGNYASYVEDQFEKGFCITKNGKKSMGDYRKYKYLLDAPFKISNRCCDVMKKRPAKKYEKQSNNKPFIGTLAEESLLRRRNWIKNGCNAFEVKRPTSQPLSFWKEEDILQYIKENSLKIANVYGDVIYENDKYHTTGADRTGCTFCMFGISRDSERFLRLKEVEPKKYDYVMRGGCFENNLWVPGCDENGVFGLGYKFVIDWLNEHGDLDIKY